jgi:hypothetical protein
MKSKQPGKTNCKGCIFAHCGQPLEGLLDSKENEPKIIRLDIQTRCYADRLDTFIARGEAGQFAGSPYFQLTRLCNMKRGEEWREQQKEKFAEESDHSFIEDYVDVADQEVMPTFGIAIQDHPDSTIDDLRATLESIIQIDYPKSRMKPVISTFSARGINNVMHEVNVMKNAGHINAEAIFHIVFEPKIKDTEVFRKLVQCQYFVNIFSGSRIDTKTFMDIHHSLNRNLEQIVMFENEQNYSIIRKSLVRNVYLTFNNYEATVDHIRKMAKEQNSYKEI